MYAYVKNLFVPEEKKNKLLMLQFEGVYSNAMVYVNGQLAGKNNFGYSTFYVPLNDLVTYGAENEIRVQVRNCNMTNSRWYSGGGNPKPDYNYIDGVADTWNGRTLLILRKTACKGGAHVNVTAENGLTAEMDITF